MLMANGNVKTVAIRWCCGFALIFSRREIVLNADVIVMHDTKSFCYSFAHACVQVYMYFFLIGSTDIPISLS